MVPAKVSLVVLSALFAMAFARPGAPSYPTEEENIIPDYAYDNDDDAKSAAHYGGWKTIPEVNPDKFYDDDVPATTPVPVATETTTIVAPEINASEVVDAARAADVAGTVGAVAAVQAVEVVKAALETSETPETPETTTPTNPMTFAAESGRALGSDERPFGDAPTTDQSLYGFSKFLHDLLQVPVQVMRSVSSYLTGAFNSRHEPPGSVAPPAEHASLTSAILSQSF